MAKVNLYTRNQFNTITGERVKKGISASESLRRCGANYHGRYQNSGAQRNTAGQNDSRNKSRWSNWLDRVNDT